MSKILTVFLTLLCLAFSAQFSSAAGGGGGGFDGGGGGGRMVPLNDRSGTKLTRIFENGIKMLEKGECKDAEKQFRSILKEVPRNSQANYLRGVALQCQDKHKHALRYFKRSKRDDALYYRAYLELGLSQLQLDRSDLAHRELDMLDAMKETCGERCPTDLLKAREKLRKAVKRYDGEEIVPQEEDQHGLLFDHVDQPQTSYLTAVSLIHSERFEDAILELGRLAASLGPHPDVLNYLGYANRRLGRFDRAQNYYEQVLAIDPMHRGANEYLGEMWVELGRMEDARERLAVLENACPFGCAEYEDLRRLIEPPLLAAH